MKTPKQRQLRQLARDNAQYSTTLEPLAFDPDHDRTRIAVWRSRYFLVQVFDEGHGVIRLSVNRCMMRRDGAWMDGISWDELQRIKSAVGYGDRWAVEAYPADADVVNDANMRHLWVCQGPQPPFFWRGA